MNRELVVLRDTNATRSCCQSHDFVNRSNITTITLMLISSIIFIFGSC